MVQPLQHTYIDAGCIQSFQFHNIGQIFLPNGSSGFRTLSHSSCRFTVRSRASSSVTNGFNFLLLDAPKLMAILETVLRSSAENQLCPKLQLMKIKTIQKTIRRSIWRGKLHNRLPRVVCAVGSLTMADKILLQAYKGRAKSVNLSNKNLTKVPGLVGKLSNLKILDLKNNRINSLPVEFAALEQVGYQMKDREPLARCYVTATRWNALIRYS